MGSFRAACTILAGGFLSAGVVGAAAGRAAVLKSKAVPGVLGVLFAEPNEANAPDPSPNAEEPPVVGEARAPGVNGVMALKGLRPPCDDVVPKPFAVAENVRAGGASATLSDCEVDRESLLVLHGAVSRLIKDVRGHKGGPTWSGASRGSLCYPLGQGHGGRQRTGSGLCLELERASERTSSNNRAMESRCGGQCASVVCGDLRERACVLGLGREQKDGYGQRWLYWNNAGLQ